MRLLIRKVHMFTGLFSFTAFVVYGIAGLDSTLGPAETTRPTIEFFEFSPPKGVNDKAIASAVRELLKPPPPGPSHDSTIRRNAANDLRFTFYSPSAATHVVVLEKENRLRVERTRQPFWRFMNLLHAYTPTDRPIALSHRLWAWYNEAAMFSLVGMTLSGVYLWLASRPGWRPAQYAFSAGSAAFLALYLILG